MMVKVLMDNEFPVGEIGDHLAAIATDKLLEVIRRLPNSELQALLVAYDAESVHFLHRLENGMYQEAESRGWVTEAREACDSEGIPVNADGLCARCAVWATEAHG